ncbi:MAG TPA: bifunctional phosphopantothenoylcysteine decarboxylase/phosphopantothenate--cysteine ligase CoaBC [Flavobacteriales bacterium]|nr:bifunctional phosphopantothenoylcysteine decarboxylase/phosphopantothenate--cysteine ligase CoaBC [Flavobacteriales bacterium]
MGAPSVLPRRILLGITGGIAAYKTPLLVRALVKAGAEVQVVMSRAAHDFVSPLVLSTLSQRPALTELVDKGPGATLWNDHVHLAHWADAMVVAPATANTLAQMAQGLCDDLLLACWLSAECPVYVAPAMDLEMFRHAATKENLANLRKQGVHVIGPETGELASGLVGEGRMTEPDAIVKHLVEDLMTASPLAGLNVLVTAGPTHEAIDPVRFIGNSSSGKMGFALAEEAARRGAHVELVAGPVALQTTGPGIWRTNVVSAAQMADAAKERFPRCHLAIMSAAVADWRPAQVAGTKMKKEQALAALELEPTEDILAWMGKTKRPDQLLTGFALETTDALRHAQGKLERKNLDLIVLNSLEDKGAGFGHDTNKVTLIDRGKNTTELPLMSKADVARAILDRIEILLRNAE